MRIIYTFFVCGSIYILTFVYVYHWWSSSPVVWHSRQFRRVPRKTHVLMIIADDLRPQLGIYNDLETTKQFYDKMVTPNLNYFAQQSFMVKKAFVQYAMCSPSRASAMTSRRPRTTRVYNLKTYWRTEGGNFTTLPQYFKEHGYLTQGIGKIFHHGEASGFSNDAVSWTHSFYRAKARYWKDMQRSWKAVTFDERRRHPLLDDEVLKESQQALETLSHEAKAKKTEFFLAVGFYKPHLPWIFPEEYLYKYPLEDIDLSPNIYAPRNVPSIAGSQYYELLKYGDLATKGFSGNFNDTVPEEMSKQLRRAYYACVSYIDHQIGQLLGSLKALGLEKDTAVAFWGDHGFLLGDQGTWGKHSLFELAARVPLMLRVPGITDRGLTTDHLVELVDLFPTLVDVAGLPPIEQCPQFSRNVTLCTEGSSFAQLLRNPSSPSWKNRVFMEQLREDDYAIGHSVRTKFFRYTEWNSTEGNTALTGKELYDLKKDPFQFQNLASVSSYIKIESVLRKYLHQGWSVARDDMH